MAIAVTAEHTELAQSVRSWATAADAIASVRAAETDRGALDPWPRRYSGLGLATIAVGEAIGGGGGSVLDQAVAIEAAAYSLVPGPLLSTTVAALVDDEAAGRAIDGQGWLLQRHGSDWLLAAPDPADPISGPDFSRVLGVASADQVGRGRALSDAVVRPALVALGAAEASGIARWCLDTATSYARVREQFGKPIGSFQALKHLCAEMLETSECVTAAAWDAAAAMSEGAGQRDLAGLVAATTCFEGAVSVAKSCIQVLGGIGFTFEHDAHLYLRRAVALRAFIPRASDGEALGALAASGVRRTLRVELSDSLARAELREEAVAIGTLPVAEQRAALAESGLLMPHWPAPYGRDSDAATQLLIDEELEAAGVRRPALRIGGWAAPTIIEHGTDEQRERFVGPTLRGEIEWCQLFSEPEAGSDLASLRTRAVATDDGWLLTGQKVWTSLATRADWAICLARTDAGAEPHAGISFFVVDMKSSGIDIRPLRELTGEMMFNEVFLDGVFVPASCLIGKLNGGWRLARTTLANERVAMAGTLFDESVERAVKLAGEASAAQRDRVGRAVALDIVVKLLGKRQVLRSLAGEGPGAESSVAKLVGVRSRQDSAELVVELLGPRALDEAERNAVHTMLLTRCLSIAGGTTQILRNVAAERILGLPRA